MSTLDDKSDILHLVNYMHKAYETNNYESLINYYTDDYNGFGTNLSENFLNWDDPNQAFKEQHEQQTTDNIKIKFQFDQFNVNLIDHNVEIQIFYCA